MLLNKVKLVNKIKAIHKKCKIKYLSVEKLPNEYIYIYIYIETRKIKTETETNQSWLTEEGELNEISKKTQTTKQLNQWENKRQRHEWEENNKK